MILNLTCPVEYLSSRLNSVAYTGSSTDIPDTLSLNIIIRFQLSAELLRLLGVKLPDELSSF